MDVSELMESITELIAEQVGLPRAEIAAMMEQPRQPGHGDWSLPCFKLAKSLRQPPPKIAAELKETLFGAELPPGLAAVEQVAGYLNFTFETDAVAADLLHKVLSQGELYGSAAIGAGRKIVIEYSSVNIAKPLHIGHLRGTIIGAALDRLHRLLGYETVRINHLGDWGTQFGKLITAYRLWGDQFKFEDKPIYDLYQLYVRFHEQARSDPSLEDQARLEFRRLEEGDEENRRLWQRFCDLSMRDFHHIYDLLSVEFDYLTGESFYEGLIPEVMEKLREQKRLQISEGATIVDLSDYDMPPCLIRKSDEATLYATRDLAALLYRKRTFAFDRILYVVGSAQSLHFQQFFKVAELMGNAWVPDQAVHVGFGWVKFSGQMMSTREGTSVFFEEVFDQARELAAEIVVRENPEMENVAWTAEKVAVAALLFTQLRVRRNRDVNFIWEEALSFRGATGPYLQYTHARLTSLARKYGRQLPDLDADLSLLGDEEKKVIKLLADYPDRIKQAAESFETSFVAEYLLELAGATNSYWQRIRIITSDQELTRSRMQMAYAVRQVVANGLRVLGIEPLERM